MGEAKVNLSLKVKTALRDQLQAAADGDYRTLAALSEMLLDWSTEQLREAGTIVKLLDWVAVPAELAAEATVELAKAQDRVAQRIAKRASDTIAKRQLREALEAKRVDGSESAVVAPPRRKRRASGD